MLSTLLHHKRRLSRKIFTILFILLSQTLFTLGGPPPGKSSLTAKLVNIEAATNEIFRYTITLYNASSTSRLYELKTDLPPGWLIALKVDGTQVTSLNLGAGKSQDIAVEVNADPTATAKKYIIPVKAIANADSASLNLEAVVKGSYGLLFTTTSGRLSDEVTSGTQKQLSLTLKNTGSLPLNDLQFSNQLPSGWQVTFQPLSVKRLEPGQSIDVTATLTVPDKTIVGDYNANFTASGAGANAQASLRLTVKTSLLSGWLGILVILIAIGIVYYLVRKYGRR